ncbi:MAG: CYTH domain-containing protein [Barnesiella sp.]|nr:CYTH domain-containing protein [Barnesiella sp.]MBD5343628.1 CYTH domain-containing protein [Bacteroides sp.]MDE5828987.1 CYTH domain-containing protein [Duncaniella sp.]
MATEIERKFLVTDNIYRLMAEAEVEIAQCYISRQVDATVRVRRAGSRGFLTVKSRNRGATRGEWEYEIPLRDAHELASLAGGWSIEKTRYKVAYAGHMWEVDEFHGRHEGLVIAEVELADEAEEVELPPFAGQEVTGDPAYYNSTLAGE